MAKRKKVHTVQPADHPFAQKLEYDFNLRYADMLSGTFKEIKKKINATLAARDSGPANAD